MSYRSRTLWLALALGCNPQPPSAGPDAAVPADAAPSIALTGTPIVASAKLGTGEALLGTTADEVFNQINGDAIFQPRRDGAGLVQTPVNQITLGWVQAERSTDLAANLGGWGLGTASLDGSNTTRYMSMRAYQIDYYEDIDLTMTGTLAPPTGVYFVSKIYFGHSYEALFSGDQSSFTAAVAAMLPQASGSIQATAAASNLTFSNVGRGLVPNDGDALFSANQSDVMSNYSSSGPAVPIYIEYRLIPGIAEPPGTTIPWESTTRATIAIDEVDIFHNGSFLDASNTAWTVSASCKINSAVVDQDDQVWTESSVTAGGSSVDPSGFGPQDPNFADPTSTYGRYAGLPWSKAFPVNTGNVLECDLTGERTDPSSPIALPPIVIKVPIDTATSVDDRAGNYDTGNRLDYQVHYTVTYSPN